MNFILDYNSFILIAGILLSLISLFFIIIKRPTKKIIILRLLILFLVIILISNPLVNIFKKENILAQVFYMIDSSIYMRSEISEDSNISKLEYIKKLLIENKVPLEKMFFAADKIYKYEDFHKIPPDNFYTDFNNSIKNCELYSCNYDRIIYFTDGYTDVEPMEKMDVVFVGEKAKSIERLIDNIKYPDIAFSHIPFNIYFDVLFAQGGKIDIKENGKIIFVKNYSKKDEAVSEVKDFVTLTPSVIGKKNYEICARAGNERQCVSFSINILRDKLRILYLCGTPNHHYYFLREYLKMSPDIDLVSFIILRENNDSLNVSEEDFSLIPFPREEIFFKDVFHFDIFILEEFNFQEMGIATPYLDSIEKFVENGGSLLIIGGDIMGNSLKNIQSGNFKKLLPSFPHSWFSGEIKNFNLSPHPVNAALNYYMPELGGIFALSDLTENSRSIASFEYDGKNYPFISEKEYGKGRVMVINSSYLWKWKLKGFNLKNAYYFANFYKYIFSWLDFTLNLDRVSYSIVKGDKFYANAYVVNENYKPLSSEEGVKISGYISKGSLKIPLFFKYKSPGLYRSYLPPLNKGKYRLYSVASFKDGRIEKYSDDFWIEESAVKKGYSEDKLKELSKDNKTYLLNEFNIQASLSQKKEINKVIKQISLCDNIYIFVFLILLITWELIYRRLKGEL